MDNSVTIFLMIYLHLCLSFNYTFPLHRDLSSVNWPFGNVYRNKDLKTCKPADNKKMTDRMKKMSNIENALKIFRSNVSNEDKEDIGATQTGKANIVNNKDLREYEQLVIMKKYPFLDFKELDKFRPIQPKNARHSINFSKTADASFGMDPSICEVAEDGPNVEVLSRGLSGFSIPSIKTRLNMIETNKDKNIYKSYENKQHSKGGKMSDTIIMNNLKNLLEYVHDKNIVKQ